MTVDARDLRAVLTDDVLVVEDDHLGPGWVSGIVQRLARRGVRVRLSERTSTAALRRQDEGVDYVCSICVNVRSTPPRSRALTIRQRTLASLPSRS